jgi:alpha-beta hydrolase superfamily lysophospholipase
MAPLFIIVLSLVALCIAFWTISACLVLQVPISPDPWRDQSIPDEGEYVRASDGTDLFVRRWLPSGTIQQVIIALHGLGQHSGYHHRFGAGLAENGIAYYAVDLRGNGLTRTPHGDVPSVRRLYADVDDLVLTLRKRYPNSRLYVSGHSLGGAMAAMWAAERKPQIDGLMVLAPAMTAAATHVPWLNYLKGPAAWLFFPHRPALDIGEDAYAFKRLTQVINIPEEVEYIIHDTLHLQKMSMQVALAANRFRKEAIFLAPQIRIPTLTLVGDADPALSGARQF